MKAITGVMRVSIEGAVGVGKSTVLQRLAAEEGVKTVREAAEDHFELLGRFHEDKARWGYLLQTQIVCGYAKVAHACRAGEVTVVERSPFSSLWQFAHSQWKQGSLTDTEWRALQDLHVLVGWEPNVMIYLCLPPEIALERARARARECEASLTLEYVRDLEAAGLAMAERFAAEGGIVYNVDATCSRAEVYEQVAGLVARCARMVRGCVACV